MKWIPRISTGSCLTKIKSLITIPYISDRRHTQTSASRKKRYNVIHHQHNANTTVKRRTPLYATATEKDGKSKTPYHEKLRKTSIERFVTASRKHNKSNITNWTLVGIKERGHLTRRKNLLELDTHRVARRCTSGLMFWKDWNSDEILTTGWCRPRIMKEKDRISWMVLSLYM